MAAYNPYNSAVEHIAEEINCATDTWRVILSNTAPNVADTNKASAAELSTGGGYTANGGACAVSASIQAGGVYKLTLADAPTWTATGGGFSFRYIIIWNQTNDVLLAWWDNGSTIVMNGANSDTFDADLSAANGVFTLATS